MINVYIGWDPRETRAYDVCASSLKRHTTLPVNIIPLIREELEQKGIHSRPHDILAATQFTYTRFLVPFLNNYTGISIFCDCDFLWLTDINNLLNEIKYNTENFKEKAVYVVKHNYTPLNAVKMDGAVQTVYPRKNWSSLIIWNCDHPKHKILSTECVNSASGAFLHRFQWLDDKDIGEINIGWNWLVDVYNVNNYTEELKALHYTEGGPWFENYKNCSFSNLWYAEESRIKNNA
jgi:hypothetical protein